MHEATLNAEPLRGAANSLQECLQDFGDRLEAARDRIESATRLHHLIRLQSRDDDVLHEMQRLSEKIGKPELFQRFKLSAASVTMGAAQSRATALKMDVKRLFNANTPAQSKLHVNMLPLKKLNVQSADQFNDWMTAVSAEERESVLPKQPFGVHSNRQVAVAGNEDEEEEEEEEEQSKMADSGLGGCDRCEGQDNPKLNRSCSCQSLEDDAAVCVKSHNGSYDLEEEEEACCHRVPRDIDTGLASLQTNSHLFSHASSLDVDLEAEVPGIDQKTQK